MHVDVIVLVSLLLTSLAIGQHSPSLPHSLVPSLPPLSAKFFVSFSPLTCPPPPRSPLTCPPPPPPSPAPLPLPRVTAAKFLIFMAFMILCSLAATSLALAVSAICRTVGMSVSVLPMLLEVRAWRGDSESLVVEVVPLCGDRGRHRLRHPSPHWSRRKATSSCAPALPHRYPQKRPACPCVRIIGALFQLSPHCRHPASSHSRCSLPPPKVCRLLAASTSPRPPSSLHLP